MNHSPLKSAVAIARALGHPARLRTVAMLTRGDLCVCQITAALGLAPSTVSAHLRELRQAGLITEHKQGRFVFVSLTDEATIRPWIDNAVSAVKSYPTFAVDRSIVDELRGLPPEELGSLCADKARAQRTAYDRRDSGKSTTRQRHPK